MTDEERDEISTFEPARFRAASLAWTSSPRAASIAAASTCPRPPGVRKDDSREPDLFHHVAGGGRTIYITLLAESHARMISALRPFAFFDASVAGKSLSYLSGYEALEKGKLKGLLDMIRNTVRAQETTLLVLDGLMTVGDLAESALATKKFIHELQTFVELSGCTALLLTSDSEEGHYALRTMVDGLVELSRRADAVGLELTRHVACGLITMIGTRSSTPDARGRSSARCATSRGR